MLKLFGVCAAIALVASPVAAQVIYQGPGAYQQVGPNVYGPNGSTQQRVGNQVYVQPSYGAPAQTYSNVGNGVYGPNGSTSTTVGNMTYGPNGSTSQQVGNMTYLNDGQGHTHTCQKVGLQTYCQ